MILAGKVAVVTGASRGIGRAIAVGYAREGADVVVISRKTDPALISEITELGVRCHAVEYDLSDYRHIDTLVEGIVSEMCRIDILCNCAGTQIRHPIEEFPVDDWEYVMNVNCNTVFFLCQQVGKVMLQNNGGKIVNIASLLSFQGGITVPAYAASKGAVLQFTKSFANEWASRGINVNCIAPGYIDTEMNSALIANPTRSRQIMERIPADRWGKPEDIVGAAVFLSGPASDFIHGAVITVDGGWMGR